LAFNSIQILANPATIIYWIRGGRRESNRQKGPSDGFQIVVIFRRQNVRRRPSLAALFSETAARRKLACLPSAAVAH
jgi:hypothetical protein